MEFVAVAQRSSPNARHTGTSSCWTRDIKVERLKASRATQRTVPRCAICGGLGRRTRKGSGLDPWAAVAGRPKYAAESADRRSGQESMGEIYVAIVLDQETEEARRREVLRSLRDHSEKRPGIGRLDDAVPQQILGRARRQTAGGCSAQMHGGSSGGCVGYVKMCGREVSRRSKLTPK